MTQTEAPYTIEQGEILPAGESRLRREMRLKRIRKTNDKILRQLAALRARHVSA